MFVNYIQISIIKIHALLKYLKSIGYTFPDIFLGERVGSSQQTVGLSGYSAFPLNRPHSVAVSLDSQEHTD